MASRSADIGVGLGQALAAGDVLPFANESRMAHHELWRRFDSIQPQPDADNSGVVSAKWSLNPRPWFELDPNNPIGMVEGAHFTQLSEAEFADRLIAGLHDEETLYRLMLRDVYQNGMVLQNKKYRYLGLAYRTFLIGLVATFATFAGQFLFQG